jgi:hypothetical protein
VKNRLRVSILAVPLLAGCGTVAVQLAPEKQAVGVRSEAATKADELFWTILHGGDYERIPDALPVLTAAYLDSPGDSITASHIGFLHIWRLAERSRLDGMQATITDHAVLARKYFEESVRLNPSDARVLGFLGAAMLAEGTIHRDEKLKRRGYYTLRDAIHEWPEFNYFTAGYVMSAEPASSARFKEAVEWQWRTLDECAEEKVDRHNPNYWKYIRLEDKTGRKRVCWNSWIAPHNFEGFFLNMGDMLVKSGDWRTAQRVYASATLSPTYRSWRFREVLEQRIRNASDNVARFNVADDRAAGEDGRIMFSSRFACMACHQE